MATQWGSNSLAPGASAGWFFVRSNTPWFQPVLRVMPLTPSFTDNLWWVESDGYPHWNQLGVSTMWSQLSDDLANVVYFLVVENRSNSVVEYAFLEADLTGPAAVAAPTGGLVSNSNYFLENGGNPLTGVVATINFSVDFQVPRTPTASSSMPMPRRALRTQRRCSSSWCMRARPARSSSRASTPGTAR